MREHARKGYRNILLKDIDGKPLCTISEKRAQWYLEKNLAKKLKKERLYTAVLELKFKAKKQSEDKEKYQIIENKCVMCGTKEKLSAHHVVPRAIRKHLPTKDKEHQSAWVVLLCDKDHNKADQAAQYLYAKELSKICTVVDSVKT